MTQYNLKTLKLKRAEILYLEYDCQTRTGNGV